ncbi:MAG TPA: DUF427 domain-containing protein [Sphingomonadaceae bacterium]|nr:DUF427 domain-containing protein [Sphingomonadaceae bacterium]
MMKVPGPDHPITIEPATGPVRVLFGGKVVAASSHALVLREASYPAVYYIPRTDIDMPLFQRSDHASHCPYKGDASYFSIEVGDRTAADAAWSYEEPYPAMSAIAGHLAFYPDRVDRIETPG